MKAENVGGKIIITAETQADMELLNFMGFGRLKVTFARIVDERTPEGSTTSHDELTVEFDGPAPTPA